MKKLVHVDWLAGISILPQNQLEIDLKKGFGLPGQFIKHRVNLG